MKNSLLFIIILCSFGMSIAQSPQSFNYQTVVRDANGDLLVNQAIGFEIQLLEDSATGTSVYTETHTITTNAQGVASFSIGQGTGLGGFAQIDWANHTYFLQIGVDVSGGTTYTTIGISALVSVPYALHSSTTDGINFNDNGNATIAAPTSALNLETTTGNISSLRLKNTVTQWNVLNSTSEFIIENEDTENGVFKIEHNALANSIYIDDNGRIGVGLTNPSQQIHVYGDGRGRFENSINGRYINVDPGSATIDTYNGPFNLNRFSDTDIILGQGGGNVGIGNNLSPSYQLDVTGTGRFTDVLTIGSYTLPIADGTTGQVLTTDGSGITSWQTDNGTFNTSGGVTSNSIGNYASDDFVFGSPSLNDTDNSDYDERFFFDKARGAFRAGSATDDQWDAGNRGFFSVGMGDRAMASGNISVALGNRTEAIGFASTAIGNLTEAQSTASVAIGSNVTSYSMNEVVIGSFNTSYTPNNSSGWDENDRLFVVANGTSGNRSDALVILKNGNTGIQNDNPSYALQVGTSGDGTEARANAWNTFSDRRWKTDFQVIQNALEKIQAVNGYYYKWKDKPDTSTQVGVIAQEIEAVLPEVVSTDAQGYKSVDYSKLTALLIEAIKEQQHQIQSLETKNDQMESRLTAIESYLEIPQKNNTNTSKK